MRQNPSGTARTLGLGGASTSLGGDFGSLNTNPAGLGLFTKSELTLTPGLGFGNGTSTPVANAASLGGTTIKQDANSFHLASAGVVFANRRPDDDNSSDWRGGSFALGFTRLADFNQAFRYQNQTDDRHSFFQYLREPGGNTTPGTAGYTAALNDLRSQDNSGNYETLDGLAYGNFLSTIVKTRRGNLDSLGTPTRVGRITQDELVTSKGSLSQFDLGYGGNYRDKLYIGGAIGIVSLNRTRTSTFSEGSNSGEDFNYQDYVKTTGTGINARIGLIYRVADVVRLGASIQTPTYIRLTDEYGTTLTSQYTPANLDNVLSTALPPADYTITTPFRANGGATVLIGKYGFFTGDVEYVGYSNATYNADTNGTSRALTDANNVIASTYRNTVNLKAGAEARVSIFRARVGYARYGSPYAGTSGFNRDQNYYTGGLGIRTSKYFVDVAGVYLKYQNRYSPYDLASGAGSITNGVSPTIATNYNRFTASITGGLLF
ncbi:outer membrane protein transport protein [Hymenobacter arcticus]